jgi:hypothetical protein
MIKTTIGKIDATFMVFVEGVQVFIACSCVVKYQEHNALSSFYDTPDAGPERISRARPYLVRHEEEGRRDHAPPVREERL